MVRAIEQRHKVSILLMEATGEAVVIQTATVADASEQVVAVIEPSANIAIPVPAVFGQAVQETVAVSTVAVTAVADGDQAVKAQ